MSSDTSSATVLIREMDCHVHKWNVDGTKKPRALCVLYHGFLAHGNYPTVRYAAEFLAQADYSVIAVDMPGHGKSPGLRGYLERSDTVTADGITIATYATTLVDETCKLILIGSSMGGAIALSVAQKMHDMVAGVVLLAPMLKLNVSTVEHSLLTGLAWMMPTYALIPSSATSAEKQYRDPKKRQECEEDALTVSGAKLRTASALSCVDITLGLHEEFQDIKSPFLVMIAEEDVVVKNEGSEELYEKSASTDKTVKRYPALHGLLCEPAPLFDEIKKDMLEWIEQRTTNIIDGPEIRVYVETKL
jgi:caffeoylshikimate esterase